METCGKERKKERKEGRRKKERPKFIISKYAQLSW
jgi:hypothetical protein